MTIVTPEAVAEIVSQRGLCFEVRVDNPDVHLRMVRIVNLGTFVAKQYVWDHSKRGLWSVADFATPQAASENIVEIMGSLTWADNPEWTKITAHPTQIIVHQSEIATLESGALPASLRQRIYTSLRRSRNRPVVP